MPSTFKILTYRAFEPTEISGLKAWYDASILTGADGSSVGAWLDQSGNEAHMYQSTSAAQPTLQTNELNGQNVVRFDGVDDFLSLTAPFDANPTNVSGTHANSFSNNGNYLIHLNSSTTPNLFIYKKNGNNFNLLANPTTMPVGTTTDSTWTSDDSYFAIGTGTSPRIQIYKRTGDTFAKIANPSTLPSSTVLGCHYSSDNVYLATVGAMTGLMLVYKISGETYTALSNPTTTPAGTSAEGVRFSPDTNYLAIGSNASPFIQIYSRSGDTFTKLNNPTTLPTALVYSIDWLDNTTFVVGANENNTRIYKYDSASGTFQQEQTLLNTGAGTRMASYSRNKNYLALALTASPFVKVYSRSGTTYTAISDPQSLPISTGRGVSWGLNDTSLVVSHSTAPFIQAYTFDGTTLTNLTKLNMFRNVGGASVFVVAKYATSGAFSQSSFAATVNTSSGSSRIYTGQQAATTKYMTGGRRLDADSFQSTLSTTTTTGGYILQTGVTDYNNSNQYIYINGKLETSNLSFQTDGLTSNTNSLAIYLGNIATEWLNGDIAEIILFNRALTTQEITNVHEYLSRKWGIALA